MDWSGRPTKRESIITNKKIHIEDLQFLVNNDGHIVISDPLDLDIGSNDYELNIKVLQSVNEDVMTNILQQKMMLNKGYTYEEIRNMFENLIQQNELINYLEMATHPRVGFLDKTNNLYYKKY